MLTVDLQPAKQDRSRKPFARAAAIFLALLINAGLLILISPTVGIDRAPRAHEILISLAPSPPKKIEPVSILPPFETPKIPEITPDIAPTEAAPQNATPMPSLPNITGVGQSLFNCNLGSVDNPSHGEPANCRHLAVQPPAGPEVGLPKKSMAQQNARWSAALAARQTPVRVPCAKMEQTVVGIGGTQKPVTSVMADTLCIAKGLIDGFSPAK
jgi:hypothetical protein